ncbi:hypothetical protein [Streptomyces galilaeus]|uniref:hypothetical protein n=1 Tax=Streptomyces galilaeus TaxID=33899 RepID=UPI00188C3939|nr:hypothetical protein [Streptomyces galilaeus]GGW80672.1 hypothetical protein GCM10010350_76770 [Streptomyces galilaeus]
MPQRTSVSETRIHVGQGWSSVRLWLRNTSCRTRYRVSSVSTGALVTWTASDGFTALGRDQAGHAASHDSMKAIVQAAVAGLLVQLGHTVTQRPDDGGLIVLTEVVFPRGSKNS